MATEPRQTGMVREEPEPQEIGPKETGTLQFGLSTLFWLTAAVAITCSLFFRMPALAAMPLLMLISVSLPAAYTMVLIHGRGYQRAFCIGALFPAATMMLCTCLMIFLFSVDADLNEIDELTEFADEVAQQFRIYIGCMWVLSLLVGLLTVVIRWVMLRNTRGA